MNNHKIIGLITTTGKRDLTKSLNSMKQQTKKLHDIYIASEKQININENILINPFTKGLANNTMQALIRIKEIYKNEQIYIATLDDDDEWDLNFIKNGTKLVQKNFNFISGYLQYKSNHRILDTLEFENTLTYNDFLYGNPGVEGSNKIFCLDLALESGGMPKNIKTATDRAFNINLLMHPEVKFGVIEKVVAYHYVDSKDRLTNKKDKKEELRKFYKHFWHLIDKNKINDINKRHLDLHQIEEVINWK
ncbi:hypothetical protein [[Mycoplasma] mobile]|uniref:Glycosyltransferase n=1 Tax=Mycoplasma mobile (strain ATCC 43663 / 163K / NCTC 11711) TaxID=267748 RepID=Q6KH46_MYCM1|nr:hypothetical protein [[Mycoplasma] mobile]AAT28085.1 hypothetical protein MMOB5990 [Mycoplasma mobile 163K]